MQMQHARSTQKEEKEGKDAPISSRSRRAANFRFRHTNLHLPTDVHMSQAESKLKMVLLAMQNKLLQPQ